MRGFWSYHPGVVNILTERIIAMMEKVSKGETTPLKTDEVRERAREREGRDGGRKRERGRKEGIEGDMRVLHAGFLLSMYSPP